MRTAHTPRSPHACLQRKQVQEQLAHQAAERKARQAEAIRLRAERRAHATKIIRRFVWRRMIRQHKSARRIQCVARRRAARKHTQWLRTKHEENRLWVRRCNAALVIQRVARDNQSMRMQAEVLMRIKLFREDRAVLRIQTRFRAQQVNHV